MHGDLAEEGDVAADVDGARVDDAAYAVAGGFVEGGGFERNIFIGAGAVGTAGDASEFEGKMLVEERGGVAQGLAA